MKLLAALLLIGATSAPALAGGPIIRGQRNVHYEEKCYKNVERYIPGYYNSYGSWISGRVKTTRKRVSCSRLYERPRKPYIHEHHHHPDVGGKGSDKGDNNSCVEGTVAGGLLGGALGGVLSTKENWIWAIPSGMVGGAMVGCQVDGG